MTVAELRSLLENYHDSTPVLLAVGGTPIFVDVAGVYEGRFVKVQEHVSRMDSLRGTPKLVVSAH